MVMMKLFDTSAQRSAYLKFDMQITEFISLYLCLISVIVRIEHVFLKHAQNVLIFKTVYHLFTFVREMQDIHILVNI